MRIIKEEQEKEVKKKKNKEEEENVGYERARMVNAARQRNAMAPLTREKPDVRKELLPGRKEGERAYRDEKQDRKRERARKRE